MSPPAIDRTQIGRYTNLSLLGQGGMGAVYRAHDPSLDRTVAIKVVLDQNPEYLARFQREAKAVARLSHPNIVQVYDFGQDEAGNPYFVMELIKGKSLDAVIKTGGPMPSDKVVDVLRQAALGLGAAHAVGIVHRDIKPHNMLLDEGGVLKLVDFGIARVAGVHEGLTSTNDALGTLHYMAPEVLSGQPADHRADVYSLGLVAFHLLTGNPAFSAPSAVGVAMKQLNEPLPDLAKEVPSAPASLCRLVERMTLKERDRRVQNCDEIVSLTAAIFEELSRTEPAPVIPPNSRRTLLMAAGLGLLTAAGLAVTAGTLKMRRRNGTNPPKPIEPPVPQPPVPRPSGPGPEPAAQATPPEAPKAPLTGPVRVAILRFRNLTGDPKRDAYGEGVSEAITSAFDGLSDKIKLLERTHLEEDNLKTLNESKAVFTDKNEVVAFGKIIGVEIIVQGAFQKLDQQLRITARFTKVETSEILKTVVANESLPGGKSGKNEFALFDKIAAELRKELLELLPRVRNKP